MITPVNGHVLIEPVKQEKFIDDGRTTYEEIGIVSALPGDFPPSLASVGDRVFFDSWLVAKYPKERGGEYWLVKWEDVRGIEYAKD